MKNSMLHAAIAALMMFSCAAALGDLDITLVDDEGDPNAVEVLPGDSFDVVVELNTTASLVSGQQMVIQATPPAAGIFSLTAVSFDGIKWSNNPGDTVVPSLPEVLSPQSSDIGTVATDVVNGTGTGVFDFVSLTFSVDANAPEDLYKLNVVDMIFGDTDYNEVPSTAGTNYEVTVIPAPPALLLGLLGLGTIGRIRKRLSQT